MTRPAHLVCCLLGAVLSGAALATAWPAPIRPDTLHPLVPDRGVLRVAADAGQVYVMSGGQVRAYDASLRHQRWSAPIKSFGSLATGGGLVVADDGFTSLHAYDARTGKLIWTAATPRLLGYGAPGPISSPLRGMTIARGLVIGATYDDIRAWDARTGRLRWQVQAADPSTPLPATGGVISYSARTGIDGYTRGINMFTGKLVWSRRDNGGPLRLEGERLWLYGVENQIQLLDRRNGQRVTVRYAFPGFRGAHQATFPDLFVHDAQVCAFGLLRGALRVQCQPRTAGRYVSGDRRLLTALRPSGQHSSSIWEQGTRQVIFAADGTWLLGGSGPVRLKLPWAKLSRRCSVGRMFAEAGPYAVFSACAAFGPGRVGVVDQRSGRLVALIRALGDVKAAWTLAGRLVVLTDQAVFSVAVPDAKTRL